MPNPDSINPNVIRFWKIGAVEIIAPCTSDDATVTMTCTGSVQFLGDVATNGLMAANTVFAKLPDGFRPKHDLVACVVVVNSSGTYSARPLFVGSNGEMKLNVALNGTVFTRGLEFSVVDSIYGV